MNIDMLFSRGLKLSDVPPDFRGMPGREWPLAQLAMQSQTKAAEAWRAAHLIEGEANRRDWNDAQAFQSFAERYPGKMPQLNTTKILTPRDTYGMKGVFQGH